MKYLAGYRNQIIFNNKRPTQNLKQIALKQIEDWEQANNKQLTESKMNKRQRRKTKNISWQKPKVNFVKLNFDAASNNNNQFAFGFIIRDHHGLCLAHGKGKCNADSVLEAEAFALREGLQKANTVRNFGY